MESYILRIYRYSPEDDIEIVGTLTELNGIKKSPFKSQDELWSLLKEKLSVTNKTMEDNHQVDE